MLLVRLVILSLVCLSRVAPSRGPHRNHCRNRTGSEWISGFQRTRHGHSFGDRIHPGNNEQGRRWICLPLLPVGSYSITVEVSGFNRFEQRGIVVQADQNATVPISLKIGSATQSVTVEANAQMVETRSGALSKVITQRNIVELPLNGRNAASLIFCRRVPVTPMPERRGSGDTQQTVTYPARNLSPAMERRADMVNYNLDGGSNQDHYTNVNNPFPESGCRRRIQRSDQQLQRGVRPRQRRHRKRRY